MVATRPIGFERVRTEARERPQQRTQAQHTPTSQQRGGDPRGRPSATPTTGFSPRTGPALLVCSPGGSSFSAASIGPARNRVARAVDSRRRMADKDCNCSSQMLTAGCKVAPRAKLAAGAAQRAGSCRRGARRPLPCAPGCAWVYAVLLVLAGAHSSW
jgi:hypothetical protein